MIITQCCPNSVIPTLMNIKRPFERFSIANPKAISMNPIAITHEVRLVQRKSNPWGSGAYNELYIDYNIFSPTIPIDFKWYVSMGGH